jgi:RHS repeat-associated protein
MRRNGLDRVTGITQASSAVAFQYDNANRKTQLTLPNGIQVAYNYDGDSRVTEMIWTLGGNQIGDLEYSYDSDGHVIEKTGSMAATNLPQAVSGNAFNADNEMTAFNGNALTYDTAGNLTNDGTDTYAWDARNQLGAIAGGVTASFVYGPFGRRMSKTINGPATSFLYDRLNPVQELQNGSPSANMLTGLGIDEYFQRTDSNGTADYLADALGSTLALTDSSGNLNTAYTYEPFGNTTVSGTPGTNPFQFTGRENDGTGLYYYRARYYSPTLQRFVAQDPLDVGGGDSNLYAYASNDPLDKADASGQQVVSIPVAFCAVEPEICALAGAALVAAVSELLKKPPSCESGNSPYADCPFTGFSTIESGVVVCEYQCPGEPAYFRMGNADGSCPSWSPNPNAPILH